MGRSRAFIDHISRSTFKGVERRDGGFKITRRTLTQNLINELVDVGINNFGYSNASEAKRDILDIFTNLAKGHENIATPGNLDMREIVPGSVVSLIHDGGHALTMLTANEGAFIVLKDSEHTLNIGDVVYPMHLNIREGEDAQFQVLRSGESYPSENHLLTLSDINTVTVKTNDGVNLLAKSKESARVIISGSTSVYALQPSSDGGWFTPDSMTTDSAEALFKINFRPDSTVTYSFNDDRDFSFSNIEPAMIKAVYEQYRQQIFTACETNMPSTIIPLNSLKTQEEGILEPTKMGNGAIWLKILKKAIL